MRVFAPWTVASRSDEAACPSLRVWGVGVSRLRARGPIRDAALPWRECFAKSASANEPGLTVLDHCHDVGMVARALLQVVSPAVLPLLGGNPAMTAACHDIGKVSPGYQLKYFGQVVRRHLPELADHPAENYELKHALIGEAAVNAALGLRLSSPGMAVGAHHGVRDDPGLPHDAGVFGGSAWARQRLGLFEELVSRFGALVGDRDADRFVLAGLVCVADWIGSDERFFGPLTEREGLDTDSRARRAVAECGWRPLEFTPNLSFGEVFGFEPHTLQRDFIDAVRGPGLYVLEAPMGTGKTEAALYAAYRLITSGANSGLYFGLPTRLTSDKIHERVSAFLRRVAGDDAAVRLAHGNAWLRAFQPGGGALAPGKEWFNPAKRALLMPFGVGTIDQALMAVVKVKHFFVRCFGLAGKVVVLDEVHSYDVYTGSLLDVLVRRLLEMRCTVLVLSATLTGERRDRLLTEAQGSASIDEYPLITVQDSQGLSVRPSAAAGFMTVDIEMRDIDDSEVAERAAASAAAGQCVICIANTVARAQSWYNGVKAAMAEGAFDVGLLHSRFPGWRREELEQKWTKALGRDGPRPAGCVLVATQVVEQSVDLDADFMITELAPTDMLLQRLGRLWRHERSERPCSRPSLVVVTQDLAAVESRDQLVGALGSANSKVYSPYVLWRTFQVWKSMQHLQLPADIRHLLEATYAELREEQPGFVEEAQAELAERAERLRDLAMSARADVVGFPPMVDREGATTRYSDYSTVDAVVARSLQSTGSAASILLSSGRRVGVDNLRWIPDFAVALHRNLVPVPQYRLKGAKTPAFLSTYFHEPTPVLVLESTGDLHLDGLTTDLRYDDERGLQMKTAARPRAGRDRELVSCGVEDQGGFDESDW